MKNLIQNSKRLGKTAFILFPCAFFLGAPLGAQAQPTTLVKPRQWTLFSGWLTNSQAITNNAALPGQIIGAFTNTLTPYSGSHPIGLAALMSVTNSNPGASNVVVNVYPAYDINGGVGAGIGTAYGTNFATVPILTWNASYKTNANVLTNLASSQWEPSTSLGFTISNASSSNVFLTLVMSQAP
jgi:hypothetical protein